MWTWRRQQEVKRSPEHIFSFGCVLYEMLTGKPAFEGDTVSEILAGVLKIEADFTRIPQNLNPKIQYVLRRCLEKNPKRRWHAIGDVRVEIENILAEGPERVPAPAPVAVPPQRPLWKLAVPVAAAALLASFASGLAVWRYRTPLPQPVMRFQYSLPEGQNYTNPGRQLLAISPDGTQK